MSNESFRIVENDGRFFVTDPGGHALFECRSEKEAREYIEQQLEPIVGARKSAAREAERQHKQREKARKELVHQPSPSL